MTIVLILTLSHNSVSYGDVGTCYSSVEKFAEAFRILSLDEENVDVATKSDELLAFFKEFTSDADLDIALDAVSAMKLVRQPGPELDVLLALEDKLRRRGHLPIDTASGEAEGLALGARKVQDSPEAGLWARIDALTSAISSMSVKEANHPALAKRLGQLRLLVDDIRVAAARSGTKSNPAVRQALRNAAETEKAALARAVGFDERKASAAHRALVKSRVTEQQRIRAKAAEMERGGVASDEALQRYGVIGDVADDLFIRVHNEVNTRHAHYSGDQSLAKDGPGNREWLGIRKVDYIKRLNRLNTMEAEVRAMEQPGREGVQLLKKIAETRNTVKKRLGKLVHEPEYSDLKRALAGERNVRVEGSKLRSAAEPRLPSKTDYTAKPGKLPQRAQDAVESIAKGVQRYMVDNIQTKIGKIRNAGDIHTDVALGMKRELGNPYLRDVPREGELAKKFMTVNVDPLIRDLVYLRRARERILVELGAVSPNDVGDLPALLKKMDVAEAELKQLLKKYEDIMKLDSPMRERYAAHQIDEDVRVGVRRRQRLQREQAEAEHLKRQRAHKSKRDKRRRVAAARQEEIYAKVRARDPHPSEAAKMDNWHNRFDSAERTLLRPGNRSSPGFRRAVREAELLVGEFNHAPIWARARREPRKNIAQMKKRLREELSKIPTNDYPGLAKRVDRAYTSLRSATDAFHRTGDLKYLKKMRRQMNKIDAMKLQFRDNPPSRSDWLLPTGEKGYTRERAMQVEQGARSVLSTHSTR